LLLAASGASADLDNNVAWGALSHAGAADRMPIVPRNGEAFDIGFYAGHFDLSAARVGFDPGADGQDIVWIDAAFDSTVGPRDRWTASLPAAAGSASAYIIEVTDGSDIDYLIAGGVRDTLAQVSPGDWWRLDFQTLAHAPLGASPVTGGTVFRVWAPNASTARVRGSFNNWSASATPMTRLGDDLIAFAPGAEPGDAYKFYFNNFLWKPDPRARWMDGSNSYNSVIVDPNAYQWQNAHFTPAPAEEWVVYQLHVGTFAGLNDPFGGAGWPSGYRDVAERVDHLADLGINAVMLNPTYEFPGSQSGGYNPVTAYAMESSYGSAEDFKYMVDTLHGAGIAVILDTVWNHFSSSDNFLWDFDGSQIYYDSPQVDTPWGAQADFDRPEVRDYFVDSVMFTMGENKLDGMRHDAIYEMVSATQWAGGQQIINDSMDLIRSRFPDSQVIAEIYNNDPWNTSPGGLDLDGQYHEAFKNAIDASIDQAGFGDPDMWRLANTIDGSGPWVEGDRVFNYFELHDEAWSLSGNGRTRAVAQIDTTWPHDDRFALGRTKLGNGITLLAQGMPAILMGTEWAEDNGWETAKIDWSHRDTYAGVLDFYRDLIGLRTTKRALFANSPADVFHVNDGANVMAFERYGNDGRSYVIVANFSNSDFGDYRIGIPRSGAWGVIVNSEDSAYQGTGAGEQVGFIQVDSIARDGKAQSASLSLPAHGLLLLQHNPEFLTDDGGGPIVEPCEGDADGDNSVGTADLLVLLANWGRTTSEGAAFGDFDGDGSIGPADLLVLLSNYGASC
jgi:1,4-alpha-glucan branching enzyme